MRQAWADLTLTGKVLLITLIVLSCLLAVYAIQPTKAQDTAPAWEYGALIYETDSAFVFTADLAKNAEINKAFDEMDDGDLTVISAMNIMGAEGWEYIETQGSDPILYLFKRPK